jgi:hypothetical protein
MLCLFAFSITPRKTLHDLFGCHTEKAKQVLNCEGESLATETFHCACDQPELQVPFIEYPVLTGITTLVPFRSQYIIPYSTPICESTSIFSKLRGPPATV